MRFSNFSLLIATALHAHIGLPVEEIEPMLEQPPDSALGDYAFPCFRLAKTMRKAPPLIAQELKDTLSLPPCVLRTEVAGGYLNFFIRPESYAEAVLCSVREEGERFGGSTVGAGRNVCIDYSSINIAKPFHIGHLSSTVIGHALYRIYKHMGYNSVGINHLGDWGTQFGKLIVAYQKWGVRETVEREKVRALLELYVRFHDEAEKDPSLDDEARAWFKKIEDGDEEALALFAWFKELTLEEVGRVYDMLGISFDSYAGESFYNDKMDRVIAELKEKNLLKLDKGAYIVDLEEYKMPPCIILRSDGATLYATRDIAAAIYRKETYDFAKSLYVVAYQQDLHFRQLFQVIDCMGYPWAKDMEHVSFGMVSMQDGTLSTRKGKVLFLEDVLNAAVEKTLAVMEEKSPDLQDKPAVAKQVGVGAVVFAALYNSRIKDVVFSWDKALNFEGETGPYLQYAYARCCSVLKKSGSSDIPEAISYEHLCDEDAQRVLRAIYAFPEAVRTAMEKNEPYFVSRATMAIAQSYNKFYFERRIIGEREEAARLALTAAARRAMQIGLYLIGLSAPEQM